jgi:antitoxin YefM
MSTEDETSYLLRNPAGARRLLAALDRARRGELEEHELSEPPVAPAAPDPRE